MMMSSLVGVVVEQIRSLLTVLGMVDPVKNVFEIEGLRPSIPRLDASVFHGIGELLGVLLLAAENGIDAVLMGGALRSGCA
ncbi:MAG: hypothetical protein R3F36_07295 [Candidatus Competibacteraceae bacterium]